jgi:hypothetical protein
MLSGLLSGGGGGGGLGLGGGKLLKLTGAVAGLGGTVVLGGALLRLLPKEQLKGYSAHQNALLHTDPELFGLIVRLRAYSRFAPHTFDEFVQSALELLKTVRQTPASMSHASVWQVAASISSMVESVRRLRVVVRLRMDARQDGASIMAEFDDVAGGIQTLCRNYQQNATLSMQHALDGRRQRRLR